ncbi:MAG: hypothetical protein IPI49_19260 [Myxococcales bacterium]|nr:hypothetical protein [Myxococcales bacterium]
MIEIVHEELEARGCRRIGFDDSQQVAYRPGGFYILVKRVAKYEVVTNGDTTRATTPAGSAASSRLTPAIEDRATTTPTAETAVEASALVTTVVVTPSPETLFPKRCSTPRRSRTS